MASLECGTARRVDPVELKALIPGLRYGAGRERELHISL